MFCTRFLTIPLSEFLLKDVGDGNHRFCEGINIKTDEQLQIFVLQNKQNTIVRKPPWF